MDPRPTPSRSGSWCSRSLAARTDRRALGHDDIDALIRQRCGKPGELSGIAIARLRNENEIPPLHVATLGKRPQKRGEFMLRLRAARRNPMRFIFAGCCALNARGKRDRHSQPRNECAALH